MRRDKSRATHSEATNQPPVLKDNIKVQQTDEQTNITSNEISLVQALYYSMVITGLPTPESSVFSGDPRMVHKFQNVDLGVMYKSTRHIILSTKMYKG